MKIPLVAIVGLPNAGKSTLFNKILGSHKALTHEIAGTTRDRHYGPSKWNGLDFMLVDTAGIVNRPDSPLEKNVQLQTAIALEEADLVLLVVDGKLPLGSTDRVVAKRLSKSSKPVVLAANKIDTRNTRLETQASEYMRLGLGEPIMVSAASGAGLGDLLDKIVLELAPFKNQKAEEHDRLRLAFVGKPNVGKSSLINSVLKDNRLLVDAKAGTTRSTVDIPFEFQDKKFLLLDTAGVKKRWKQDLDIEAAAAMQSLRTIPHTDVALFVIDCSEPITFQDRAIAQTILEQNKGVIIVLNKTDLLTKEERDTFLDRLPDYLPQMWWAPVIFTSALKNLGVEKMLELAVVAHESASRQIAAEELDRFLERIMDQGMPGKMEDQRKPRIYNFAQTGVTPPVFVMTVNFPAAIAPAWRKWFEKQFRLKFGFEGTPIVFKYVKRI